MLNAMIKVELSTLMCNKYRKSYEHECISWCMGTSNIFKVLKIARARGECNLRTLKISRVTIYHEMHDPSCVFLFIIFSTKINWSLVRTSAWNICNFLSRSSCPYSSSLGLNFLSFAHFPQTFNHISVDVVMLLFFWI